MYEMGQLVIYGAHGVCRILDVEMRTVDRKPVSYYMLEPLSQPGTRYYVPCYNPAATAKMRNLLDRVQVENLLADKSGCEHWTTDENQRKQLYRRLINSPDPVELVQMVRSLHQHRDRLHDTGKRMHMCDENFLHDAERILYKEFSIALEIPEQEVASLF